MGEVDHVLEHLACIAHVPAVGVDVDDERIDLLLASVGDHALEVARAQPVDDARDVRVADRSGVEWRIGGRRCCGGGGPEERER